MSELIRPEQIIHGIKTALRKCNAITEKNEKAIISLLDIQVINDIRIYGEQANEDKKSDPKALPIRDVVKCKITYKNFSEYWEASGDEYIKLGVNKTIAYHIWSTAVDLAQYEMLMVKCK